MTEEPPPRNLPLGVIDLAIADGQGPHAPVPGGEGEVDVPEILGVGVQRTGATGLDDEHAPLGSSVETGGEHAAGGAPATDDVVGVTVGLPVVRPPSLIDEHTGEPTAYARLLGDAMAGDGALFTREDAVEAAWTVVDPILDNHAKAILYDRGGWGPKEADALFTAGGGWDNPSPEPAPAGRA